MEDGLPVACTLVGDDRRLQHERWRALLARSAAVRVETREGLRIRLRDEAGVEEEVRALVAVERRCCGWASWEVARADGAVVLTVRARGDGVSTLHTMFPVAGGTDVDRA